MLSELHEGQPVTLVARYTLTYGGIVSRKGRKYAVVNLNFTLNDMERSHLIATVTRLMGRQVELPAIQENLGCTQVWLWPAAGMKHERFAFLSKEVARQFGDWETAYRIQRLQAQFRQNLPANRSADPAASVAFLSPSNASARPTREDTSRSRRFERRVRERRASREQDK